MASQKDSKKGWHFLPSSMRLGYGDDRKAEVGKSLVSTGDYVSVCYSGMHASERPSHAAAYEKGPVLCRVRVSGDLQIRDDKFAGRRRKVLWAKELTVKDLRACLKAAGVTGVGDYDKAALLHSLASAGPSRAIDGWLIRWAIKNGCTDVSAPLVKPDLNVDAITRVLMPRVIRTKKEILGDLGSFYELEDEDGDDLFDVIAGNHRSHIGIVEDFTNDGDGYYLRV